MNSLQNPDPYVNITVPREAGEALKALALGIAGVDQQKLAYRFIIYGIAGKDLLSSALPGGSEAMAWNNGRRYVGLQIERIVADPMEVAAPLPPARTISERVRRRGEK